VNWEARLGPSDGVRDAQTGRGVTFAPTWTEAGKWVRMAGLPERYRGKLSVQFVHPLLVRCAIDYSPVEENGPSFRQEFVLTPDGVLATLRSTGANEFGVTWPVLEDDGARLRARVAARLATTAFGENSDEQNFLAVRAGAVVGEPGERVRSTYGWLLPVRATATNGVNDTFVYPRSPGDPTAESVLDGFRVTPDGFASALGSVHGTLYVGRTSAGGEGESIDCHGDGKAEARFDSRCRFVLQLSHGRILAAEADRKTALRIGGKVLQLEAYVPAIVSAG